MPSKPSSSGPDAAPSHLRAVWIVLCLSAIYMVLQVWAVQPYLWPAGHGLLLNGDSLYAGGTDDRLSLLARPPEPIEDASTATLIRAVVPGSPASEYGLRLGDEVTVTEDIGTGRRLDLRTLRDASPIDQLRLWRDAYWMGLRGPVRLSVRPAGGETADTAVVQLTRTASWSSTASVFREWARHHAGMAAQICVFVTAALLMAFLRSSAATAVLAALALALCGVGAGGSLMGAERVLPPGLREIMTVFAWTAAPVAFPVTALAILYFPRRSELLARRPWLHGLPWLAATPMIAFGLMTALFIAGIDAFGPVAAWDAAHPGWYFGSFAIALAVTLWTIVEGMGRYARNPDSGERRRIRVVVLTGVPGVFAYAAKEGIPAVALLTTGTVIDLPGWLRGFLQVLVLLPAFGLTYAVAVNRVLAPRLVIRRSLQYALARGTLTAFAVLPAVALTALLIRQRDMTIAMIVSGAPAFYLVMIASSIAALKYRERARTWLDRQFFRQEYDSRKILLSLATRVQFETDPNDLAAMVVNEADEALHPEAIAILVSGVDEGLLTPVTVLRGSAESLPINGALATMLRWSDQPLDTDRHDPRSVASRLPDAEKEWLECTGAALLVPVVSRAGDGAVPDAGVTQQGSGGSLIAVIVLGDKRSEDPYTSEDRQLLASIAGQMALGFDVARLRRRVEKPAEAPTFLAAAPGKDVAALLMECPACGRCEEAGVAVCPTDGVRMTAVSSLPRSVDNKYRIDQLLGRGGMGAVYRARDVRLDRDVALKVVRADLLSNPDARRRFRREAQIVARLQHPAVVSIFDYGTLPGGDAYLVMEFVKGEDLRQAIAREGRFPPSRACRLIAAVCSAIEAAHREGILHRDLKPENILLPSGDFVVKVLDFGVAKLLSMDVPEMDTQAASLLTIGGAVVGTPAYMAPEQLKGQPVDGRADVFSLGVIAYELLTGALPFGRGPLADIALRHYTGAVPMTSLDPQVPPALDRAVLAALHVDPAMRPASPAAFAQLFLSVPD